MGSCICQALKSNSEKCLRSCSLKVGDNPKYCWQHQNFPTSQDNSQNSQTDEDTEKSQLPEFRQLTLLGQATNMIYYPDVKGRRILILGESHSLFMAQYNCQYPITQKGYSTVLSWLQQLDKNSPTCVDLLLELDVATYQPGKYNPSPLTQIGDHLNHNKPNRIRLHPIDLRVIDSFTYGVLGISQNFKGEDALKDYLYPHYLEFLNYLLFLPFESDTAQKFEELVIYYQKSINPNQSIKSIQMNHRKYLINYGQHIRQLVSKLDSVLDFKRLCEIMKRSFSDKVINEYGKRSIINSIPMDLYTILKLFSQLETTSNCTSAIMDYSILYTGTYHLHTYKHIIYDYFQIKPELEYVPKHEITKRYQCIPFSKPFDFFGN